ncbi:hypothetical protein ETU08_00755 [Apibacter muscae]|uniref:hypothetical protein n=1 Tax=Apibacter muscae TaxID=2509004 RepID=UPI0011AC8CC5|nr:hypothetical protein [Apibacter muscae]TWP31561.1 hypothetical protein ETU08_00755 [Apibacter muscae]
MENVFKQNQKIISFGKKAIIIATKKDPYRPKIDPYNRKELYPKKDYLIMFFKEIDKNGREKYEGREDIHQNQIESPHW